MICPACLKKISYLDYHFKKHHPQYEPFWDKENNRLWFKQKGLRNPDGGY